MGSPLFFRLSLGTALLTLCVILLGVFVRLSDAGLGCPDWPGCYGRMLVTEALADPAAAEAAFPERPLEVGKAVKEMVHRYLAGILGLAILGLAVIAWRRRHDPEMRLGLPFALVGLVIFQSILGMWTVTWLLKPLIVVAHLLGGFATLALLWWLVLRQMEWPRRIRLPERTGGLKAFAVAALVVVVLQVSLGGWTSANYAALACPDFPTCQGEWWPEMDFQEGFTLWRGIGVDYEFGVLENEGRVAAHVGHRIGALVTTAVLAALVTWLLVSAGLGGLGLIGLAVGGLLAVQVLLGIANIELQLPIGIAVAHNGVAAVLVAALVTLNYVLWRGVRR